MSQAYNCVYHKMFAEADPVEIKAFYLSMGASRISEVKNRGCLPEILDLKSRI